MCHADRRKAAPDAISRGNVRDEIHEIHADCEARGGEQRVTGTIGYAASMEQFAPSALLRYCQQAEEQGFTAVMASDHFHPWVPSQGESGFVWSFMGALGATTNLRFGPGVTPPGFRYHPAIVAQAAATLEEMFPGRFYLGLGAGEALNEHIVGDYWPEAPVRLERLMEAIDIIKQLFTGKKIKHRGTHFTLESARLYTMPATPPRSMSPPPARSWRTAPENSPTASSRSARRMRS
jgi:coenzyme F420-dependent glucose-6-phosphate dehydrogenase